MPELLLFSRPDCHLCDEAAAMVVQVAPRFQIVPIDIEDDLALISRYGDRVPVLRRPDNGAELGWPFDEDSLQRFLEKDLTV